MGVLSYWWKKRTTSFRQPSITNNLGKVCLQSIPTRWHKKPRVRDSVLRGARGEVSDLFGEWEKTTLPVSVAARGRSNRATTYVAPLLQEMALLLRPMGLIAPENGLIAPGNGPIAPGNGPIAPGNGPIAPPNGPYCSRKWPYCSARWALLLQEATLLLNRMGIIAPGNGPISPPNEPYCSSKWPYCSTKWAPPCCPSGGVPSILGPPFGPLVRH